MMQDDISYNFPLDVSVNPFIELHSMWLVELMNTNWMLSKIYVFIFMIGCIFFYMEV